MRYGYDFFIMSYQWSSLCCLFLNVAY